MSFGWRDSDWIEPDEPRLCRDCCLFDGDWCLDRRREAEPDDEACFSFDGWEDEDGIPVAYVLPPLW